MSDKSTEQIFWELDAFIECSVFSPPEDAIQNAHGLLAALRQRHADHDGCADPEHLRQEREGRIQAEAENARLRELLRQVVANGVDDYWVTTDEGAIWLDWVHELTKEAKAALERREP